MVSKGADCDNRFDVGGLFPSCGAHHDSHVFQGGQLVAYLFSLISTLKLIFAIPIGGCIFLAAFPVLGAGQRELCLNCHPPHYAEQGSCTNCHGGNPDSDRKNIAHFKLIGGRFAHFTLGNTGPVREGERILQQYACRRCHVSGKKGNLLAASLDRVVSAKTSEEILLSIKRPVLGMPDFRLPDKEMTALVNAIHAGAKKGWAGKEERPLAVLFTQQQKGKDAFTLKCGSCHKILSERKGVLGGGDYGPNLSGLLTEFYPQTFDKGEAWHEKHLQQWLENPRKTRAMARMQPVAVTEAEWRELLEIMAVRKKGL